MTDEQADAKAKELLGSSARAKRVYSQKHKSTTFYVGKVDHTILPMFLVDGLSRISWEDAFEKATENLQRFETIKEGVNKGRPIEDFVKR